MNGSDSVRYNQIAGLRPRSINHAREMLPVVRTVLEGCGIDLLCAHVSLRSRHRHLDITYWSLSPEPVAVEALSEPDGVRADILGALGDLVRDISDLWPQGAKPGELGFASDGHALIFSADYPSARGSSWLLEHLQGKAPASVIIASDASPLLQYFTQKA